MTICARAIWHGLLAGVVATVSAGLLPASGAAQAAETALPAAEAADWWPETPDQRAIRVQIEALSTEYYYRLDHGEAEGVVELFTPDGVLQMGDEAPVAGHEALKAYYAARPKTRITRHVSTNLRLSYLDADHVEAIRELTYYHADTAAGPGPYFAIPAVVEYRESLVRGSDGRWRYASRKVVPVFGERY